MVSDAAFPHVQPALAVAARLGQLLVRTFISPGSTFSLISIAFALMVAAAYLAWRRPGRRRSPRLLIRALFPRWLLGSASMRADLGFLLLNIFITSTLIGWAVISYSAVNHAAVRTLSHLFGPSPHLDSLPLWREAVLTLALFLAYDFSYWIDHWLKHNVPALWEFHRVHHTAEVLSPVTVFRMHPVDQLVFANISALFIGAVHGVGSYVLGGADEATLSGTNVILVVFIFAVIHLQHSHVPIRFGGWLGRLLLSPAHHQIHHSTREEHYGGNLGSCLAVWDWMFGSLVLPDEVNGRLKFGSDTEADPHSPHSVTGALVLPFIRAARALAPKARPQPTMTLEDAGQSLR